MDESDNEMNRHEAAGPVEDNENFPSGPRLFESATSDIVRRYLSEIGRVRLLTAVAEMDLGVRMESASLAEAVLQDSGPIDVEAVLDLARRSHLEVPSTKPSPDEAVRICLRLQHDGAMAKRQLIEANLRLVVSVARRFTNRGMAFLDLVQEGNLGLMRAAEKFDYKRGFKFSTYATWWIRQAVTRAIADQARTIRLPAHVVNEINMIRAAERHLVHDLGREPHAAEIAEQVGITAERVRATLNAAPNPISLETPAGENAEGRLGDFLEDSSAAMPLAAVSAILLHEQLGAVLETMTKRENDIIQLRFGLRDAKPRTLEEVGREFGLTRERIRQIELRALCKLRHPARSNRLRDYCEP